MFSFVRNRSIFGFSESGKKSCHPVDLSCLLTKYKNYCNDEYSTLDDSGMSVPPMACKFAHSHSKGHVLSVVDEDGYIVLYNVNKSGQEAVLKTWQVHSNAVFDVEWVQDDQQILTASGDQSIALWDVEKTCKLESFRGHSSSVRSIACRIYDNAVFASGSRDGHIMIWDRRVVHKVGAISSVNAIYNAHALQQSNTPGKARKKKQHLLQPKDCQQSVTAVVFQDENYLVSAGSVDGCIKIWDMRKTYKSLASAIPVRVIHYQGISSRKHGYSSLTLDQSKCRLFASCTDDIVYEYNLMSHGDKPVHQFKGHKNSSFYVKTVISPNNQFLLSGSSDHHAYIWQINKPEVPPIVLKAHDAEVSSVEWCHCDFTKLVTLSDDAKTKFWRIYSRELKSNLHPQWFGRARRFSRDRSTSTVETLAKATNPMLSSESPISSPHGKLITPTLQSSSPKPVTKSPSVRDWLKRKPSVNLDVLSEPSSSKAVCHTPGQNDPTDNCTSPVACPGALKWRKRTLDLNEATENSDSTQGTSGNEHLLTDITSTSNFQSQAEETPTKRARRGDETELKGSASKSCFSPVKPHRSKVNNCENIHHPSPQKLKHGLNLEESPVSSPKRPCLTNLDGNGAFHRPLLVRQSLFGNREEIDSALEKDRHYSTNNSRLPKPKMYQEDTDEPKSSPNISNSIHSHSDDKSSGNIKWVSPENLDSPTHNLPNLVKDQLLNLQSTPSHRITSPQTKKLDWLTQLRLNKSKKSEDSNSKHQSPTSMRSSPKISQNVRMRKIQDYFTGQSKKGNN